MAASPNLYRLLAPWVRPYRGRFVLGSLLRLVSDLVWLYPAYAYAKIVTLVAVPGPVDRHQIVVLLATIFGAVLVRLTGHFLAKYIGGGIAERVARDLQEQTMQHLWRLDMSWHEGENTGNKLKRLDNGLAGIRQLSRVWFTNIIEICVMIPGIVIILFNLAWEVAVWFAIFSVVYLIMSRYLTRYAVYLQQAVYKAEEDVHGLLMEGVANVRTIKALDLGKQLLVRVRETIGKQLMNTMNMIGRFQIRGFTLNLWGYIAKITTVGIVAFGIIAGRYEVGLLLLAIGYFDRMRESIQELADIGQDIAVARTGVTRLQDMLTVVEPPNEQHGQAFPTAWQKLEFVGVGFAYGEQDVLRDVNLTILRGQKVGIVGLSGAGKTTLLRLLLREYSAYEGDIRFDSVSLREVAKGDYLQHVAAVLQDTDLFYLSLADNITLVDPVQPDAQRLKHALTTAHLTDVIAALPQGDQTVVGERGIRLSGGQRQRVGIARAVYKQPDFLLLDEATSHLDSLAEGKVQAALHDALAEVTAIVIAHRLSTLQMMDRIIVIHDGRIVEDGTLTELQQRGGLFAKLWAMQHGE